MIRRIPILVGFLFLTACGSDGVGHRLFHTPVDIRASTSDVTFGGRTRRLVYVANQDDGTVVVLDQQEEEVVDTDRRDEFNDTPLTVGGEVSSIAIDDRSGLPHVFAADARNRRIVAYEANPPLDPEVGGLIHAPLSLGGPAVGVAGRPSLVDGERRSTPAFSEIVVDPDLAVKEYWKIRFDSPEAGYTVEGSASGVQESNVLEGEPYSTDSGAISFMISTGAEGANEDDYFRFGTAVVEPFALVGSPVDLQIDDDRLLIVTNDPAEVVVFDLDTLTPITTIPITDGSPTEPSLGKSVVGNGHLYIANSAAANAFDVDLTGLTLDVLATGIPSTAVGYDGVNGRIYFTTLESERILPWTIGGGTPLEPIVLSHFGLFFAPFEINNKNYALVSLASGASDVLNLSTRKRVDTVASGEPTESYEFEVELFDVLPASTPELLSVNTVDGTTLTERWQLFYEGILPGTEESEGVVAADQFSVTGALFQTWGVQVGDHLILDPADQSEEMEIQQVLSEEILELTQTPSLQGAQIGEVRPFEEYLVIGTESGLQTGRVVEGTPYTSDNNEISLTIRPSFSTPTTRGDAFTFQTYDGFEPIRSNGRLGNRAAIFTRPGTTVPTAYVVQAGSNTVSVIDLNSLEERGVLQ